MYKNIFSCKDKVAVVIGGCGLLGKEIVAALTEFGVKVYSADICKAIANHKSSKNSAQSLILDITSEASIKRVLKKIKNKEKRIDILINCAYPRTKDWGVDLQKVSFTSWKKNINDHLGGYFLTCRLAAEIMKKQRAGVIINFASIYGFVAPDFKIYEGTGMTMPVAYAAIKGGIISLTKYFASYYGKHNIRVNCISPGGIKNKQHPKFVKKYSEKTILNRMGTPEDVVGAIIYLSSDASQYVTGVNLIVDGGLVAR